MPMRGGALFVIPLESAILYELAKSQKLSKFDGFVKSSAGKARKS